jgi:hypothetical protein
MKNNNMQDGTTAVLQKIMYNYYNNKTNNSKTNYKVTSRLSKTLGLDRSSIVSSEL